MKLIVSFRNFAKAPKKSIFWVVVSCVLMDKKVKQSYYRPGQA